MSRRLIACAVLCAARIAHADDSDLVEQGVGASLGVASGGRVTPGGLRIAGHYLYQLSRTDWFDGSAAFTFGTGGAECFRDRSDSLVCNHGLADGAGVELSASVRRYFGAQGTDPTFRPFARVGVGAGIVHFSDDSVTGATLVLHGGGGVRARVSPDISIVAEGELALGAGLFGHGLGGEPQAGLAITAGVELRL